VHCLYLFSLKSTVRESVESLPPFRDHDHNTPIFFIFIFQNERTTPQVFMHFSLQLAFEHSCSATVSLLRQLLPRLSSRHLFWSSLRCSLSAQPQTVIQPLYSCYNAWRNCSAVADRCTHQYRWFLESFVRHLCIANSLFKHSG
jgi:hypothetical protein